MSLRRVFLGFGTSCALVAAACSTFGTTDTGGAQEDGGPLVDAGGAGDAPTVPDGVAATDTGSAPRWCASQDAGFLCDDFDEPDPAGQAGKTWAPWDRLDVSGGGGGARDATKARSLPNAFLATASGVSRHILQKGATLTEKRLFWGFDISVDSLVAQNVVVAEVAFGAAGALVVLLQADAGGTLSGFLDFNGSAVALVMPPLTPHLGEWFHMRIDFEAKSGSQDTYRAWVGDAAQAALYNSSLPGTVVALGLGARLNGSGTAAVRFDNVTMRIE